jgi:uncharacterized membrane protein
MRISRLKLVLLLAMSVFGLWSASMVLIIYNELHQSLPLCPAQSGVGIVLNCNAVLGSKYSQLFGIPLEFFAAGYFVVNTLLVCLIAFGSERVFRSSLNLLFGWRFLGLIFVPYLVSIELFIIRAICVYCTIMHIAIVSDFVIITYFLFYKKSFPSQAAEEGLAETTGSTSFPLQEG